MRKILVIFLLFPFCVTEKVHAEEGSFEDGFSFSNGKSRIGLKAKKTFTPSPNNFSLVSEMSSPGQIEIKENQIEAEPALESMCTNESLNFSLSNARTSSFASAGLMLAGYQSCNDLKLDNAHRFSEQNCKLLVSCSKTKSLGKDSSSVELITIPKLISEDYATVKLLREVSEMEKIEALRKFAEKKYGHQFASKCKSPFDYSSNDSTRRCEVSSMDNGFLRLQKKSSDESHKKYAEYAKNFKSEDKNESVMQSYLKEKTDIQVNDSLINDTEMLDSLSLVMASNDKLESKLQKIFSKLEDYKKQGKLDPVFGYSDKYIDQNPVIYKKSTHYNFFKSILSIPQNIQSAKIALEERRKEVATNLLNVSCSKTESFNSICSNVGSVNNFEKVKLDDGMSIASILDDAIEDERFSVMRTKVPSIASRADYNVIMDAQRCRAFNLVDSYYLGEATASYSVSKSDTSSVDPLFNRRRSSFGLKLGTGNLLFGNKDDPYKDGESYYKLVKDDSKKVEAPSTEKAKPINVDSSDKTTEKENFVATSGTNISNSTSSNYNYNNSGITSEFSRPSLDHDPMTGTNALKKIDNEADDDNTILMDKISNLQKRLAGSEENLERIQTEKEVAKTEKERQRKIEEENKTIVELKEQIKGLKSKTLKSEINKAAVVRNSELTTPVSSTTLGTSSKISSNSNKNEGHIANSFSSSPVAISNTQPTIMPGSEIASNKNEPSTHAASMATSTGMNSSGQSGTKSGIVLTQIDGLTAENANEKISDKILELNGVPLYVEEGGIIKEFRPVVMDGKIVLDDQGKPIYKIFVVKTRNPAAIINSADLKYIEEERLKLERAEYLNLKKLTTDVLKK